MESLKEADAVEPAKAGLLGNKEIYVPKKATITRVIEKIRAELLEDGEISEDVIALTALILYFSYTALAVHKNFLLFLP